VLQKKICMLGSYAVGKTSLVRQYVDSIFSENYTTTIGVKIDKKTLSVLDKDLSLVVWDVYGEDSHQSVVPAYLRGMSGYLLVVDPTRLSTFKSAVKLHTLVHESMGAKPFILVKNKSDLKEEWNTEDSDIKALEASAHAVMETSAKMDTGVDAMFESLAQALISEN